MLLAAVKSEERDYFGEMMSRFFSVRQIKLMKGLVMSMQTRLVDGSMVGGFEKILQEKGRFLKHLFLFSTLHIAVRTG